MRPYRSILLWTCIVLPAGSAVIIPDPVSAQDAAIDGTIRISVCGDGVAEDPEECDGGDLRSQTCESLGFDGGALACTPACEFDTSACLLDDGPSPSPPVASPPVTGLRMDGSAYPDSELAFLKNGLQIDSALADSEGGFSTGVIELASGSYDFGVRTTDTEGWRSATVTFALDIHEETITTVLGIILPPTIELSATWVEQGDPLTVRGQGFARSTIELLVSPNDSQHQTQADGQGRWAWSVPAAELQTGVYEVSARSITPAGEESPWSQRLGLTVAPKSSPTSSPTPDPTPEPAPEPDRPPRVPPDDAAEEPVDEPEDIPIDDDVIFEEVVPPPVPTQTPEPPRIPRPSLPAPIDTAIKAVPEPVGRAVATTVVVTGAGAGAIQSFLVVSSIYDLWLLLLRLLLTVSSFLGIRKRPRPWGTVYDAVTKRPLDPAYVVAYEDGKEVASAITELDGRYGFLLPPGTYKLRAHKTHYEFPALSMENKHADELYANLYHGGALNIGEGELVTRDIPMDPVGFDWNEYAKSKKALFAFYSQKARTRARIFNGLFLLGFLFTLFLSVFFFSVVNALALTAYTVVFLFRMFRRFRQRSVAVKDAKTGEPLSFAIIRLFSSSTGRLVKSVAADEHGRFYFLVPPGAYTLTVEKKLPDGTYRPVHQSKPLRLPKGVLEGDVLVPEGHLEGHEA